MTLIILGSYSEDSIEMLRNLRDGLRDEGFTHCYLVEDLDKPKKRDDEGEDEYLTRKSLFWVERSDACIFVFNASANNESVGYELKHASDHLPAKLETTVVTVNTSSPYASTLVRGHIKRLRDEKHALVISFNDEKTLFKASRNAALGFLKTLAPVLDIRSDPI